MESSETDACQPLERVEALHIVAYNLLMIESFVDRVARASLDEQKAVLSLLDERLKRRALKAMLGRRGYVLLPGHAQLVLDQLETCAKSLEFAKMDRIHTQPDGLRRHISVHSIPGSRKLAKVFIDYGHDLMTWLLGEDCPVYKPTFLATAPGAVDQRRHVDQDAPDTYSILVAIHPRQLHFADYTEPITLPAPADVLIFDAQRCHGGAGRKDACHTEGVFFALHMFAGKGINHRKLDFTFDCRM
tara:strand:+ start:2769 stop:3503 length:735 start_codon:yes stop_codon:yes gene_type:complete